MKTIFILSVLLATSTYANEARYTVRAKCYAMPYNARTVQIYDFGVRRGLSNFSCDNAVDNLQVVCDGLVKKVGLVSGSVYRDILIREKSATRGSSVSVSTESSTGIYGLGLLGIHRQKSESYHRSEIDAQKMVLDYVPVTEADCKTDAKVRQDDVPTIQDSNLGG